MGQTLDLAVIYNRGGQHRMTVTGDSVITVSDSMIVAIDPEGNMTGIREGRTSVTAAYEGLEAMADVVVYK
ncbi:hypothetical protein [Paenibacillus woosongensis]|uniref:BIG2 domain-containing protein n=1 Tax=Paenibacillus woosongensis TaxID=307580 RepID=A0A7X3CP84_9BACL|nr:hypothetical protein [Paenibacillus woosongensis]MUG45765.1 hypothetical protein [Paenibacillus woosongensis]